MTSNARAVAALVMMLSVCLGLAACVFDEAGAGGDLGRADAQSPREGGQIEAGSDAAADGQPDGRADAALDAPDDGAVDSPADGDGASADTTVDTVSADATVDTVSPDATVDAVSPDATVDTVSPDATVDTVSPDATVDTVSPDSSVDASVDQGLVKCTTKYGSAPGYVYCSETPTSCTFKVSSGGSTCQTICSKFFGSCLGGRDNLGNCTPFGGNSCLFQYQGQICTCSR